ncbi:hypothetical protein BT69DRAFT_1241102 [Atractiella rhizophila]|nr:hypothetical protein BT69DRAFT_1241102 [Atractiella rhizophila]
MDGDSVPLPTSPTSPSLPPVLASNGSWTLSSFSLQTILGKGKLLLASTGKEFDKREKGGKGNAQERLEQAKMDMVERLGLGGMFGGVGVQDELTQEIAKEVAMEMGGDEDEPADSPSPETGRVITATTSTNRLPPPRFQPGSMSSIPPPRLTSASRSNSLPVISSSKPKLKAVSPPPVIPEDPTENEEPLSARERNRLKRKRKGGGKLVTTSKVRIVEGGGVAGGGAGGGGAGGGSGTPTPVSIPAQLKSSPPQSPKEGKKEDDPSDQLEHVSKGGEVDVSADYLDGKERERVAAEYKLGSWPFQAVCEALAVQLFSEGWEARHGAACGLREILKLQGASAGMVEGLPRAENERKHEEWCEDLATRILCVFALDRFGDFTGDHVVAPVRETASQTLASLLLHMPLSSVVKVNVILIQMIYQDFTTSDPAQDIQNVWQVRHAGLLGLKYLVAVKSELLKESLLTIEGGGIKLEEDKVEVKMEVDGVENKEKLLQTVVNAALIGLKDKDDDVKAVAASTLLPIADAIVNHLPAELHMLIDDLWGCLGELKDDLASSVAGVMDLLAELMQFPTVLEDMKQQSSEDRTLPLLIPKLYPYFRHTISGVRLSVVKALNIFLTLDMSDFGWLDERLLRLLFQNIILEERSDIRASSLESWSMVIKRVFVQAGGIPPWNNLSNMISDWIRILTSEIGTPMPVECFYDAKGSGRFAAYNIDKAMMEQDLALVDTETVLRGRIDGCTAFSLILAVWPEANQHPTFFPCFEGLLNGATAFPKFVVATIIEEWMKIPGASRATSDLHKSMSTLLLSLIESEGPNSYLELYGLLRQIRTYCQGLYDGFVHSKVPQAKIPDLPPFPDGISSGPVFSISSAEDVVERIFDALVPLMGRGMKTRSLPPLKERQSRIRELIRLWQTSKTRIDRQTYASIAGGIIALAALPPKLTPLIKTLTTSIKGEENIDLQKRAALSIASLIDLCNGPSAPKSNPSDKLLKNLCTFLCQDPDKTPLFASERSRLSGILTLQRRATAERDVKNGKEGKGEPILSEARLVHRGAHFALSQLADRFGEKIFQKLPKLWECMSSQLLVAYANDEVDAADATFAASPGTAQEVVDCLTVLPTVLQTLHPSLHFQVFELLPKILLACRSKFAVIRYAAAKGFADLAKIVPVEGMKLVVTECLPFLADPLNVTNRQGVAELISHVVDSLDVNILPYVLFLVVPVLGRMSDSDEDMRLLSTHTFATLIKLVPLESGLPDPPGFSDALLKKRDEERQFLSQLLDGSKVVPYEVPVVVNAELRKYQREGVSWLAFLAKYQLHGILCDDMGLGKTLQSITILASKHHERAEEHKATKSADSVHLPSLIVCPPTLTGHWEQEILTYATNLKPLMYGGTPGERERLAPTIRRYDAVICTYDIVRNDIEILSQVTWNYCILDEGHVIRNSKTKLTKATKLIRANHRLILSGTPIQNNVVELWSLFDFLMPGFLGSEKSFHERFGKPILASRDAKSSSKEQQAGAKALEALHKQVLPFLLRRLKEDVLDDLPPKIIQDYNCDLSLMQLELFEDFKKNKMGDEVEGEIRSSASSSGKQEKKMGQHVFQAIQYLKKLVNHPALVFNPQEKSHMDILERHGGGKGMMALNDVNHAPKLLALKQLLSDCGIGMSKESSSSPTSALPSTVSPHRALIFCQLKRMLDLIETTLFQALMPSVTYMRLDGSTDPSKRHAVVQTFNSDPSIDCLLLTTHVGGLGLNLTGADTVIFVEHDWNPMKDLQAMDRAHRLGQRRVVNVYRLITRATLEEKIMGLQRFKLSVANTVVSQQNSSLASMDTDQLLDLFTIGEGSGSREKKEPRKEGTGGEGKMLLEGLEEMERTVEEEEYGELNVDAFRNSLK